MRKRMLALLLAVAMVAGVLAGCGSDEPAATTAGSNTNNDVPGVTVEQKEFSYPMEPGDTLQYWCELNTSVSANYANLGDTPFGQNWQKVTGTTIEFLHPPAGQTKEQFSLIIADGDLPDMMEYNWSTSYPGGPEKAIKDGVILPLNDIIDQYCPNLKKYLEENPEIDKMIKTDEGHYYAFPFIRGDEDLLPTRGAMLRKDWLDELGMEVPTTIDEWYDVLVAFRDEMGASAPLTYEYNASMQNADPFAAAYETNHSFYIGEDGRVHYGPGEENYKNYLMTMHQWYQEGLIDADIATMKNDQVSAKITNGDAGAALGYAGSRMGTWTNAARANNPDFELVAAPIPTLKEGETAKFGFIESPYPGSACVAITTSCEDVERVARLLDYAYSEEGHLFFNFGVEGVSYEMIDGYPTYTDEIMNNPEGRSIAQAMAAHIRGNYNGPFVQDIRYLEQYYVLPEQVEAPIIWGNCDGAKRTMPPITPTSDESREFSTIMNEINTYRDEMKLKFIFGDISFDEFDEYLANLEKMGLSRALEIQNTALDRYNAR